MSCKKDKYKQPARNGGFLLHKIMDAERFSGIREQAIETNHRSGEILFGLRTPERPVDDESYPTVWLMTDEEYQLIQENLKGGE